MSEILNGPDGNNVSYPIPAATDTIDPAPIVICTPAPDSLFPLGDTTVTCTATDASGNSFSEELVVSVVDTTAPFVIAPADQTFEATGTLTSLDESDFGTATASDLVGVISLVNDSPRDFVLGPTLITWTATDTAGNSEIDISTVTVEDTTSPTIQVPADITIMFGDDISPTNTGTAIAADIVDANPAITFSDSTKSRSEKNGFFTVKNKIYKLFNDDRVLLMEKLTLQHLQLCSQKLIHNPIQDYVIILKIQFEIQ